MNLADTETVHCQNCGYCLAGTEIDSRCPECAWAVKDSVITASTRVVVRRVRRLAFFNIVFGGCLFLVGAVPAVGIPDALARLLLRVTPCVVLVVMLTSIVLLGELVRRDVGSLARKHCASLGWVGLAAGAVGVVVLFLGIAGH